MFTLICDTFNFSKPIFGLVFLPGMMCMKEMVAIQAMSKRELKKIRDHRYQKDECQTQESRLSFILSSFMSCNLFDMTVVIGLPYLINSLGMGLAYGTWSTNIYAGKNASLILFGLLSCLALFLLTFAVFRFRLSMIFGFVLMVIWILYMGFVFIFEVDVLEMPFLAPFRRFGC